MLNSRLLTRIQQKKEKLDSLRPLPVASLKRLKEHFTVEWIYNSNAIEGSTLTLRETQLILETGLTIGGKSLREHFEVTNHKDAIEYVEKLSNAKEAITPFHVRQIHKLVLTQIDDENAGQYRKTEVRILGASHIPPEAWELSRSMTEWGNWLKVSENKIHPVELAALAHHRLVAIHPFIDGNGRTARLVMNLILFKYGYPPAVILQVNRKQYYQALMQADSGKIDPLINFVGRSVERSLTLYLDASQPKTKQTALNAQWISLTQAAEGTPYSQEYLSLLARQGRIEAIKRGRVWYTTRKAIKVYKDSVR
jgi:Fic family protein